MTKRNFKCGSLKNWNRQ